MRERGMFIGGGEFHSELKRRVAAQLTPALIRRGRWRASFKGLLLIAWALGSWAFLVFAASTWWQALLGGISLALGTAGVAFSVGHDANHGAFFPSRRWNRIVGYSFDLIGASSYVWRTKHNVAHHTFTNVDGADTDIDQMPFARLAPSQPLQALPPVPAHLHVGCCTGSSPSSSTSAPTSARCSPARSARSPRSRSRRGSR